GEQPAGIGLLQIGERKSLEHRLLAMPYRFFLKSDLSGKITGPNGTKVNGPFHNDNPTDVSLALDVLVSKQLLTAGEYIQKTKTARSKSYGKCSVKDDPAIISYLKLIGTDADGYRRSLKSLPVKPVNAILLPDGEAFAAANA
ncbi:unnamed protein product, partial [Didymodactylos carnosus]